MVRSSVAPQPPGDSATHRLGSVNRCGRSASRSEQRMSNPNDQPSDPSRSWPSEPVKPSASPDLPPPPPAPYGVSAPQPDPSLAAPYPTSPAGAETQGGRAGGGAVPYTTPSAFAGPG